MILDGIETSNSFLEKLKIKVERLGNKTEKKPKLKVILVGSNPASLSYVTRKKKMALKIGMDSEIIELPEKVTQTELMELIDKLNNDREVNGILCQLPLPSHINEDAVCLKIDPSKDVDCFHPYNLGLMVLGDPLFLPCTPAGILVILRQYNIETSGKNVVVIGRSNIVGRPLSVLLSQKGWDATVTVAHSRTANLESLCAQADILIPAIGKANLVTTNHVKDGAVVIDVGINRITTDEGKSKLVGDADFNAIKDRCSAITPVPGGVGPMTIAMLLANVYNSFCATHDIEPIKIF